LAQAQGRVKGVVSDSSGKPIADAKVTITCPDVTTYKKELTTDKKGTFVVLIVDATKLYLFHIEAPGFQAIEQLNKPLIGAQTLELKFELKTVEQVQHELQEQALEQPGIKQLREGKDLLDAGKKTEARAKFAEAATLKPDLHIAWLEMGLLDLEAGQPAAALSEAQKCLEIQAMFANCLALAANAAKDLGDDAAYEKYMASYKFANPSDPAVLFNEAAELLNKQDDAGARPLLEQALAANPEFAPALFELGMIHVRAGESAKAKELLDRLLKVAPDYKDAPMATEMLKYL
jgi:tetratricopeptide (TPR) repeat protein